MFFKSIRFKITIVYMAILALTLSLFSAILYHYVRRSLYDNMDAILRSKADGIVQAINAYWTAERLGSRRYGAKIEEVRGLSAVDFAAVAQRWVQERSKDPKLLDIIVQIFDTDGVVVASSKNTQGITTVSKETFASVLKGTSSFDMLTSSYPTKRLLAFRVFLTPAIENDRVAYVVQVASPLSSIQMALNSLRVTLFILFPATVLITGIMGALLAKLTLSPVDNMIKIIHEITAENMKLRLNAPKTNDEIQKLAETFNDMLSRLDIAFSTQKKLFEDLSHELKTPLTILKGEFEVVLKKLRSSEEYESVLISSLEEIDKIVRLTENLLILASFESKKIMPEKKELDLNLLVQVVVNTMKRSAERKGVSLALSQHGPLVVAGDEQELKHLLINLLDNAVKYTPSGGSITLTAEKDEASARIRIKDTGIGIPEKDLGRIFERFYRVDKQGAGRPSGFGLGLSIVKSIVEAHNGRIDVESRVDEGTIFTVYLPLVLPKH